MLRLGDLLRSGAALMASQLLTAFVGFVFWLVAARTSSQTDVGFASAVISGMSLVGAVGVMGLGTLLIYDMPRHPGREMGMIAGALLAVTVIGAAFGLGFVAFAPLLSSELDAVRGTVLMALAVAVGSGLTSASLVTDQAAIGLLRSRLQLARNVTAAVARLAMLVGLAVIGVVGGLALVGSWVVSIAVSILGLGAYAAWTGSLRRSYPLQWDFLGVRRASALKHHVLNLAIQVPGWAMPLVAVVVLSARTNAGFYVVWLLVGLASFIPVALCWVLYAWASRDPATIGPAGWLTLRLSLVASVLSTAGLWLLGPLILGAFGSGYSDEAGSALLVLPLTLFPVIVKGHFVTIHRVESTVLSAAGLVALGAVLEIVGAFIGAEVGGLVGLGVGLFIAMFLEAAAMWPTVARVIISSRASQPQSQGRVETT